MPRNTEGGPWGAVSGAPSQDARPSQSRLRCRRRGSGSAAVQQICTGQGLQLPQSIVEGGVGVIADQDCVDPHPLRSLQVCPDVVQEDRIARPAASRRQRVLVEPLVWLAESDNPRLDEMIEEAHELLVLCLCPCLLLWIRQRIRVVVVRQGDKLEASTAKSPECPDHQGAVAVRRHRLQHLPPASDPERDAVLVVSLHALLVRRPREVRGLQLASHEGVPGPASPEERVEIHDASLLAEPPDGLYGRVRDDSSNVKDHHLTQFSHDAYTSQT
mmetsp:Transcript_21635/g.43756  ORF Transcript_21635/g.43756 Transcript_21635/m.43756 type:complete len:273 (+) Transcript_21635:116-934(+)